MTARGARVPHRRALVWGVLLLGVLGSLSGWCISVGGFGGPTEGGPLARDGVYGYLVDAENPTFTDGMTRLVLSGNEPATITKVTSNGGSEALKLIGVMVSGPDRRFGATQYGKTWPPGKKFGNDIVEGIGAEIRPADESDGTGYELLLGYQIIDQDIYAARDSITIEYTVDDEEFVYTEQARIVVCPRGTPDRECSKMSKELYPGG